MKIPAAITKLRKYWIRKDREAFLLGGLTLTAMIAGQVSTYWHFQDRVAIRKKMKINARKPQEVQQNALKEVQFMPTKMKSGSRQYYKIDNEDGPAVPGLDENEGN
ncbi:MAG TPA: hypothetical protein DCZ92_05995 [Elusimicrobia bacterium]|nr:MAG: hypothetical protein A2016_07190 [Elusimicrobia bacterium GWF2_62_30]HBA60356.1 hypothetical protein [Elusimicrobiota bacterium]